MHSESLFSASTPTALLLLLAGSSHAVIAEAISKDEIAALCPTSANGQMKCIEDGSQFVLCNGLSSVPQAVGLGTKCVDRLIQFAGVHDGEIQSSVVSISSSSSMSSVGSPSNQSTTTGTTTTTTSSSSHSVRTITIHESASSSPINATTATAAFKLSSDPSSGNNRSFDFANLKSDMQLIYPLFHGPPRSSNKNQSASNNTVAATGMTTNSRTQQRQPTATTMTVTHTDVVTLSTSSVPRSTSTVMVTVGLSTFTALPG